MRELLDLVKTSGTSETVYLDDLYVTDGNNSYLLEGRKWVSGRFEQNIGIDTTDYGAGPTHVKHAHILGRKGKELGVVNVDGTSSHGTKFRLHSDDIKALRGKGFVIRDDGLVEWTSLGIMDVRFLLND